MTLLQPCCAPCGDGAPPVGGRGDIEPLEIQIELDLRLAGKIGRGPAVERAVAERAGDAVDHHHRAVEPQLGFGRQRRLQRAGRFQLELDRNVLPLARAGRRGGADVEGEWLLACFGAAGDPDLAVIGHQGVGVDAVDAMVDAVAHIGKLDRAVGHRDAIDDRRVGVRLAAGRGRPRGRSERRGAFAQQRHMQHGTGNDKFGDLRMARPDARQRHVGPHAADGQAAGVVALLRILQNDVVHRHVELRPHADPGRARNRQALAGLALHPRLDRRGQESGRDPDDREQHQHHEDGGNGAGGDFQGFHGGIPERAEDSQSIAEGQTAQSRRKWAGGAAKLCDL